MRKRAFLKLLMGAIGCSIVGKLVYGLETNTIQVSKENISLPYLNKKIRVVAVSDVHSPSFNLRDGKLVSFINAQVPDIFIMAGDIIDKQNNESIVKAFKDVNAKVAKLATLGNWEYISKLDLKRLATIYKASGVQLLINQSIKLGGLMILGCDDWVKGSVSNDLLERHLKKKAANLIISHCPVVFNLLPSDLDASSLFICGHTHGGQIVPFGIVLITPRGSGSYVSGWYHQKNSSMYVMRGVGTTPGLPFRIGVKPEVLVLDLVPT